MIVNKRKCSLVLVLAVIFIDWCVMPGVSGAAVKEVTFFPNSANVEESAKISPSPAGAGKQQMLIALPAQTDPESLAVSVSGANRLRIEDIQVKQVLRADENRISQLRAQLKKIRNEKKEMHARSQALDIQLQFWQAQTKAKTKTIAEADALAATIGRNSRKILTEKNSIENDLERIEKQIKELQDSITQTAGKNEKAWEAVITLSGSAGQEAVLQYSYILSGCGWQPLYRLEALPASNTVVFSWDAEIWQSTGTDWNPAQIRIATLQPVRTLSPRDLPEWVIRPKTAEVYKSSPRERSAPARLNLSDADHTAEESAPVETTHTNYSVWTLGKKTITAGPRQRLKIKEESWPARFVFLARPSLSPQAFLQAGIKLAAPVDVPAGQATFVIDGAVLGKRTFALAGTEADIYFGSTPFVTVTSLTMTDQTGGAKFFQTKQTRQWRWLIEARNDGRTAARVRVEEPIPQPRDERIKLSFNHQPDPSEKDSAKLVWFLDVPPSQTKRIETGVTMEAPRDMRIDFGWRR
ncbi:MAG: mucoidy inhibitor MuiA family protein [Deltaproteobacteria bacterium]|nr:mucoidy inhibitor MuiA family protein [Deltaproteobacteria bacterium]